VETYELLKVNGHNLATTYLNANSKNVVIFCHGYRSSSIGPSRLFVRSARLLAKFGISSIRFDQFGSGNSEGDFFDSSYEDWVRTTVELAKMYLDKGYKVALLGQSMGGSTVISAGSILDSINAVVSWVPDPSVDKFSLPKSGIFEECGEIVSAQYWQEAHKMGIASQLKKLEVPAYILQAEDDIYVSNENHDAIFANAGPEHSIEKIKGLTHSAWPYEQAQSIMVKSVDFIRRELEGKEYLLKTLELVAFLRTHNIDPLVYGSLGASLYLGNFKEFDDIDLLVDSKYVKSDWNKLIKIMGLAGYTMIDESEHEFKNDNGVVVAFADIEILRRDGIIKNDSRAFASIPVGGTFIRTLPATGFIKAYEFSQKDGYRLNVRGKKDRDVILRLQSYVEKLP